jgi:hypothetical protein
MAKGSISLNLEGQRLHEAYAGAEIDFPGAADLNEIMPPAPGG